MTHAAGTKSLICDDWVPKKQYYSVILSITAVTCNLALAPTNEAVRRENHAEKNLYKEKNYRCNPGGHERCKDSTTIKKA